MSSRIEEFKPLIHGEVKEVDSNLFLILQKDGQLKQIQFPYLSKPYLEYFVKGLCVREIVELRRLSSEPVEFSLMRKTLFALSEAGALENHEQLARLRSQLDVSESASLFRHSLWRTLWFRAQSGVSAALVVLFLGTFSAVIGAALFWWVKDFSYLTLAYLFVPMWAASLRVFLLQSASFATRGKTELVQASFTVLGPMVELDENKHSLFWQVVSVGALIIPYMALWRGAGANLPLLQALTLLVIYLQLPWRHQSLQKIVDTLQIVLSWGLVFFVARALVLSWKMALASDLTEQLQVGLVSVVVGYLVIDILIFMWQGPAAISAQPTSMSARIKDYESQRDHLLAGVPLFRSLTPQMLAELNRNMHLAELRRGLYICRTGDRSTDLYLLLQGRVGVYKRNLFGRSRLVVELYANSLFGEGGFFFKRPRDADLITLEDCILCRIERPAQAGWNQILDEQAAEEFRKGIWAYQALAGSKIFQKLPFDALQFFLNRGRIVNVAPQSSVIKEGEPGKEFYLVIQGRLVVSVKGVVVRILKATDFFGEVALIRQTPRTATVAATESSLLFRLDEASFWQILGNNLELGRFIEKSALRFLHSDAQRSANTLG